MQDFHNFFGVPMPAEDRAELERQADRALAPRNKDGLINPIMPAGPGPAADMAGQIYYPAVKPDQDGCVQPLIFDQDCVGGQLPSYMEYAPGWERPDRPYDGRSLEGIIYCDPVRNLLPRQQALLRQASSPPPTVQPVNDFEPTTFVLPKPVQKTPYGMAVETKEGKELLANFNVTAVRRFVIKKHGEPDAEEFELEVSLAGTVIGQLVIGAGSLDDLVPIITKRFPACHPNEDVAKANLRIANAMRDQIPSLSTVTVVKSPGFIRLGNQLVYAHDGARISSSVEFRTGFTIPCDPKISQQDALRALLGVLELAENSPVMLPLLLESHLGPLYNLFDAAGFTPKFVLFLHGQTGSLKTAVVQALFRLFKELPENPEATFRDTPTALEVKIGGACSRVLVIDDFQPPVTASAGRVNLDKLEHIIRLFGDGIAKSRSNSELGRAKEFQPAGCCVVTGEDTGGSHSSLLRCLVLPVRKGEVDGNKLRVYQDHPEYLHTHFFHFLDWAGKNGDAIVDFIQREFQQEREFFTNMLDEPRQADIGATLLVTAQILLRYMQEVRSLSNDALDNIEQRWADILVGILQHSEEEAVEQDPVRLYIEALFACRDAGKIRLAPDQASYQVGKCDGFVRDGNWWLLPHEAFSQVRQFWKEQGTLFPLKEDKTHALLAQAGLIETAQERRKGKMRVLYGIRSTLEGRPRMLVLRVERARAYIEENGSN